MNAFRGDFQLFARFDLDADLMNLALPDFIVQLFRQHAFVHFEISVDQAAHHRRSNHFLGKVLEVAHHAADVVVFSFDCT